MIVAITALNAVGSAKTGEGVISSKASDGVGCSATGEAVGIGGAFDQGTGDVADDLVVVGKAEDIDIGEGVCSIGRTIAGVLNGINPRI